MERPEKFYHFNKGHYFYIDKSVYGTNDRMVIILDINETKLVFAIPIELISQALNEGVFFKHIESNLYAARKIFEELEVWFESGFPYELEKEEFEIMKGALKFL